MTRCLSGESMKGLILAWVVRCCIFFLVTTPALAAMLEERCEAAGAAAVASLRAGGYPDLTEREASIARQVAMRDCMTATEPATATEAVADTAPDSAAPEQRSAPSDSDHSLKGTWERFAGDKAADKPGIDRLKRRGRY